MYLALEGAPDEEEEEKVENREKVVSLSISLPVCLFFTQQ
jgi:hypothetical protein